MLSFLCRRCHLSSKPGLSLLGSAAAVVGTSGAIASLLRYVGLDLPLVKEYVEYFPWVAFFGLLAYHILRTKQRAIETAEVLERKEIETQEALKKKDKTAEMRLVHNLPAWHSAYTA